jgi:hypothetical protein
VGRWIDEIEHLPLRLRTVVEDLPEKTLNTSYRPGGWTIRQVIHHLPDSHMNAYIRFRWALTEEKPKIKAYHEPRWAELPDAKSGHTEISLILLEALHIRWTMLLRSLNVEDLHRSFIHPESNTEIRLDQSIGSYAWHGNHHLAQIENLIIRIENKKKTDIQTKTS